MNDAIERLADGTLVFLPERLNRDPAVLRGLTNDELWVALGTGAVIGLLLGVPLAIATALFACSMPMQGLWWLGRRSVTPLPPTLLQWFHEVRNKLTEAGQAVAPVEGTPTYQSLADLLKRAFKQLDKTFLDDL